MSKKYKKINKEEKYFTERDQLKSCLDYILDNFNKLQNQIKQLEEQSDLEKQFEKDKDWVKELEEDFKIEDFKISEEFNKIDKIFNKVK